MTRPAPALLRGPGGSPGEKSDPTTRRLRHSRVGAVCRRLLCVLIAATAVLALSGCTSWRIRPIPYGDEVSPVRSLEPVRLRLETAEAASAGLLLTEIGRLDYPEIASVFWRMVYRPFLPGMKRVLIVAGVRGNEAAGVESTLAFIEKLSAPPGPGALFDADILPVVNPWGWAHGRGRNREKIDIDWDFGTFASREARIIRRFLRDKRYDLVIDLREDVDAKGVYVQLFGSAPTAAAERILAEATARGTPIERRPSGPWPTTRPGIVLVPLWRLALQERLGSVSLPHYVRRHAADAVYAVVTPTILPAAERVAIHRMAIGALIAEHAAPPSLPPADDPAK